MKPVKLFISCAKEDQSLKKELLKHLSVLVRRQVIEEWNVEYIAYGENEIQVRDSKLKESEIVLFLVSNNLFASEDIFTHEIEKAVALQKAGKCEILPVMVKPFLFEGTLLGEYDAYPEDEKPVVSWANQDEGWLEAVSGLLKKIAQLRGEDGDSLIAKYNIHRKHDEIEVLDKYNLQTPEGQIEIGNRIKNLNIKGPIGNYQLVNVNREEVKDSWWDAYDAKIDSKEFFQFYFVTSCPTQMPPSFAERMIYELMNEELEDSPDAIHFETVHETGRIAVRELPMKRNLVKSKEAFKKYFCERFDFQDTDFDFDKFVKLGIPNLNYRYVASIFKISALKWKDFVPAFLDWIVETFHNQNEELPTFLFFFVIYIENAHLEHLLTEAPKKIIEEMNQLAKEHSNSTLFKQLKPVNVDDLKLWFNELGEENPAKINEVIETAVAGLEENKQGHFQEKEELDMSVIELLQELVFKTINK